MLAKIWKKLLLVIVVIAVFFNITSKIVRRYSLDEQLNSVIGGESLSGLLHGEKDKKNETEANTIDNNKTSKQEDDEEQEEYIEEDEDYYYDEDYYDEDYYEEDSKKDKNEDKKKDSNKESKENKKSDDDEEVNIPYTTDDYFINFNDVQDYMKDWGF